jgi:IclR family transcriptional regulator, acetate operon repressor
MKSLTHDEQDDVTMARPTATAKPPNGRTPRGSARTSVQSVDRAISLLMLVARQSVNSAGKDLADAAGLPVPTAHHLLSTLVSAGLLSKDSASRYTLGPRVALLCDAYQRDLSAPDYLVAPLRELARTTGETGYLAAWRSGDIRLIAVVDGQLPVRVPVPVGPYLDAHGRATGKLLLAYATDQVRAGYLEVHPLRPVTAHTVTSIGRLDAELRSIRQRGYSVDEEEFQVGVSCMSVPFLDGETLIAAYTVSVPSERFLARRDELLAALRAAVADAAASLPEVVL